MGRLVHLYIPFAVPARTSRDVEQPRRAMRDGFRDVFGPGRGRRISLAVSASEHRGWRLGELDVWAPLFLPVAETMFFYAMLDRWLWSVGGSRLPLYERFPTTPTDRCLVAFRQAAAGGARAARATRALLRLAGRPW
jgi:hypothetical protein